MSVADPERTEVLGELALHRILVAVDGSEHADLALSAAITAAHRDNASITLITVGPDVAAGPAAWSMPLAGALDQNAVDEDAAKRLKATLKRMPEDIPVHTIYRRGKPGCEIVKAASEGDYDAIILGARGVGRVGSMLGSVSSYVMHHAKTAVFVAHGSPAQKVE